MYSKMSVNLLNLGYGSDCVPFSLMNYIRIPQFYESHCRTRKFSIIRIQSIFSCLS